MMVVKVGGAQGIDYDAVLQDVANYKDLVLIHGGSCELNTFVERLGKKPKMVTSASGYVSRRTDRETMELFTMVYAGKMNKMVVEKLQQLNVNAVGLSGIDGRLLMGKRKNIVIVENGKKKVLRDDYTGRPEKVNTELLLSLLEKGYLPVVTPPALSYQRERINADGDRAAALIASSLEADTLILLSNVPGLLRNPEDEESLIERIDKKSMGTAMDYAHGRMKKKIMGAVEALEKGVGQVILGDARIENPVTEALRGKGTVIQ